MQHVQYFLRKQINYLLASLLSLLGFSSCGDDGDGRGMMVEYGTPHATYEIKGKVTDETGKPISNIQVQCSLEHMRENVYTYDTVPAVRTSDDGSYTSRFGEFPSNKLRVVVTDVDGKVNGSFQPDSVDITLTKDDYKDPSGNWNDGTATKEDVSFKLKAIKE